MRRMSNQESLERRDTAKRTAERSMTLVFHACTWTILVMAMWLWSTFQLILDTHYFTRKSYTIYVYQLVQKKKLL